MNAKTRFKKTYNVNAKSADCGLILKEGFNFRCEIATKAF